MKAGLLFGSFNPIHVGHLIIAESALNETGLDEIWLMVSPQNPFKNKSTLAREFDRLRMAELAVGDHDKIKVSNFEFYLPKPSYTIDTLVALGEKYPRTEFSLIMGEDNLEYLHKWKNYEALLKYHSIFVYPRLGTNAPEVDFPGARITKFELPFLDISSTRIRSHIAEGKSIRYQVGKEVWDYIQKHQLYGA